MRLREDTWLAWCQTCRCSESGPVALCGPTCLNRCVCWSRGVWPHCFVLFLAVGKMVFSPSHFFPRLGCAPVVLLWDTAALQREGVPRLSPYPSLPIRGSVLGTARFKVLYPDLPRPLWAPSLDRLTSQVQGPMDLKSFTV